ncbi:MAG: site-specific DNA-methyltransferase [Thermoproteota archaeon]|nr:site-specific DNA-methyltransferase [Thermoproteota archaeon]
MIDFDIFDGNSYDVIGDLANDTKHRNKYRLIVTSPPYYGHRHYGDDPREIGQEKTDDEFVEKLTDIFTKCRKLLTDDGSLWIVIGDTRRNYGKLMIPHKLALRLVKSGYTLREDIVWYKKNNVSSSSKENFSQAYEFILFLSKNGRSFANIDDIRVKGNEAREGRNKTPPEHLIQYQPLEQDKEKILKIKEIIYNSKPDTPFTDLPTTSEISLAYGYDPEKYCPTCFRKFKRHATRKRIGDHKHYPIFAACNSTGKNPGNVWEISTKAHYGNEHFAIFPEDLISRIVKFATKEGDWVLDPFVGRGTTGIVCALLRRNFTGVDLYEENIIKSKQNIRDAMTGKIKVKMCYVA